MNFKNLLFSVFCIGISLNCFNSSAQKYNISINLTNTSDSTAYLAHYFDDRVFSDDTTQLINGKGVFSGDKPLKEGIYLIFLPNQNYFDLLIGSDQEFSITAKPENFIESLSISGSTESEAFLEFQKFIKTQNEKSKQFQEKYTTGNEEEKEKYKEALKKADLEVREYVQNLQTKFPGNSFVAKFAQFTLMPQVPDFSKEVPELAPDREKTIQKKAYLYSKDHYFDFTDFTDDRFLRTPLLKKKLNFFYEKILVQVPDSLVKEASKLIEKSRPSEDVFQYVTQFSLNYAVQNKIMGMDAAFVGLAKKYYLNGQASWADSTLLANIRERVIKLQFNLLGLKAKDLKMETPEGEHVRLHEVDAPFTILYFWEPNCGHCKKLTPRLKKEIYDGYRDLGIEVFAVYTQEKKEEWEEFIADYDLFDFINCYDPNYENNFRVYYDVYSTPIIYLLDKDKKIIAKRLDVDTLKTFLDKELRGKEDNS